MVGSVLGVLFISLVRRVMVEDPELPFPESVAASEIHKAGQRGAQAAKFLFWNIGVGGFDFSAGPLRIVRRGCGIPGSRRASWAQAACAWAARDRPNSADRRREQFCGAERQSGISGRWLYHWTELAGMQFRWRVGLGIYGASAYLFPRPAVAGFSSGRRSAGLVERPGGGGLEIYCAAR